MKTGEMEGRLQCRIGCAACCIVISISSRIPGMPSGKPAGERCVQLDSQNRCMLFGKPERPKVCISFSPSAETCGISNEDAYAYLEALEKITSPSIKKTSGPLGLS